jgi:hypothetical protein
MLQPRQHFCAIHESARDRKTLDEAAAGRNVFERRGNSVEASADTFAGEIALRDLSERTIFASARITVHFR